MWLLDFSQRVECLAKIQAQGAGKYGRSSFWLGALQTPEAFVAATRQVIIIMIVVVVLYINKINKSLTTPIIITINNRL